MAMVEEKGRAKSTPSERERVLREVNEQSVKFIHLWFTDIEGHLKSFSITPAELEGALDDGMGFDGSSITGFNAIEESDMVAIPDPTTFQLMPNGDVRVARMICDVVTPDGQPYDGDPRNVLRRALDRMRSHGLRHLQRRPRARVLHLQGRPGHRSSRRGRLLRDDDDGCGERSSP